MADKVTQVVILAEDSRQAHLAYRYLKRLGYTPHQIFKKPVPDGQGSGEQYVREQYPNEVQLYRARTAHARRGLVVWIDADNLTVDRRHLQLSERLEAANQDRRRPTERILLLIPKRHVETWIFCLLGETVDEESVYRNREVGRGQTKQAAEALFAWSRRNAKLPRNCVDSLRRAIESGEFTRIE